VTDYGTDRSRFNEERAERGRQLLQAALPVTRNSPAVKYLVKHRGLPAATVLAAPDLLYLPSSAQGRGPEDHAVLSVVRLEPGGDPTGFQATWVLVDGQPAPVSDTARKRDYFSLVDNGCRDGCWWAGEKSDEVIAAEGFCEKPLALLAAGVKGQVIGWGSRAWLKHKTLVGKKLTIVPDRAPGKAELGADGKPLLPGHLRDYGANVDHWLLNGFPDRVWITPDPACSCCKDTDDLWRNHRADGVLELVAAAMQGELGRPGWITRLARISDELERQAEIKEAMTAALYGGEPLFKGIPVKLVREHVAAERERLKAEKAAPGADDDVTPWEEPITNFAAVLDELAAEFGRYIATSSANRDTAALWCAMTHVFDQLHCMPKLALQSPTKQCGKTTFLDCLSNVVRRPEMTSGVTEASFIRVSDAWQPTWLMDEADRYLNPKTAGEALTAAINASSYRRLARKKVCVPSPDGGWDIHDFEFWCCMVMAGIRSLVDTVQDRSIVLVMHRAKPGELKHRLVNGTSPAFEEIQRKFVRWAKDLPELDLTPEVPPWLHNREADLWRPLFAIAALAAGGWPARVLKAAEAIHGQRAEDEVRLALLLQAIREEFGTSERMFTADLVSRLINREGEPWATIKRNGGPIDAYVLRGMLRGVAERDPKQREKERGPNRDRSYYTRANFEEAWARYIPLDPENDPAPSAPPAPEPETPGTEPVSVGQDHDAVSGPTPAPQADIDTGAGVGPDGGISPGPTQSVDPASNIGVGQVGQAGPDEIQPNVDAYAAGNGADADQVVDEVLAGTRCSYCGAKLNGAAGVVHGGRTFHLDACLAEHLKKQGSRA
jgi:Protein of unknown function (DUF3631)